MSWNKQTKNQSDLDSIAEVLEHLNISYNIITIVQIEGRGLSDDYFGYNLIDDEEGVKMYDIRALQYRDRIVLEQMIHTMDCDADDVIVSKQMLIDEMPDEWVYLKKFSLDENGEDKVDYEKRNKENILEMLGGNE